MPPRTRRMTAEQEQKTKRKGGTMVQLPRFKMALVPKQKKTRRDKRHGGDGNEPSAPPARVVFRNQEIQTAIEGLTASLNAKEQSINRSESEIKEIDELLPSVFPLVFQDKYEEKKNKWLKKIEDDRKWIASGRSELLKLEAQLQDEPPRPPGGVFAQDEPPRVFDDVKYPGELKRSVAGQEGKYDPIYPAGLRYVPEQTTATGTATGNPDNDLQQAVEEFEAQVKRFSEQYKTVFAENKLLQMSLEALAKKASDLKTRVVYVARKPLWYLLGESPRLCDPFDAPVYYYPPAKQGGSADRNKKKKKKKSQ